MKQKPQLFLRLCRYMKPHALAMAEALFLVLVLTACELIQPIIIGDAIDLFEINPDASILYYYGIAYFIMLLVRYVCTSLQQWILQKIGQETIYRLRMEVFEHIQSLSMNYFNTTPVGTLVTRVTNDTEALNEMFSTLLARLFRNIVKIIGYMIVMLVLNVNLALFSFILLPFAAVLIFVFRTLSRRAYRISRNKLTDLNTFLSEHLSGMRLIQIFAREQRKYEEFSEKNESLYRAYFREIMVFAIFRPLIYFFSILTLAIVFYKGGLSAMDSTITVGTLYIFINYVRSFFEPIQELAEQFGTLQSAIASAEKVFSILDTTDQIPIPEEPVIPTTVSGHIEFKHVWFAYEKEEYVLKDVSFVIEPGQKVAFVGATGAGKSSILNLIGRYYDIQKGEILIDGIDIKKWDPHILRQFIGQVQQDVFLFTGDIKTNITLGNPDISMEDVKRAANMVHASHFIESLENGYESEVTERGSTLSAGQRQLLSFARTLAYNPAILVMDEATANIDTETEVLIQQALETMMQNRTTIMVAHRLSTIQHADQIMVMHKGRLRERGNHQELLAKNGIYKKLYELQLS